MSIKNKIVSKKVTAALVLLLLLFTQAIKLSHHHTSTRLSANTQETSISNSLDQTECAICDYHLTKDVDSSSSLSFNSFSPKYKKVSKIETKEVFYFNFYKKNVTRGPPVLI